MTERLANESGYSLVEVLAAIIILTIAIIPMVTMFDTGLRSATTSGNYDTARTFANQQLEQAKNLPYATVRDNFPAGAGTPGMSTSQTVGGLPNGGYTVTKTYVWRELSEIGTDKGLIKLTVTVTWGNNNSYSATGVVDE